MIYHGLLEVGINYNFVDRRDDRSRNTNVLDHYRRSVFWGFRVLLKRLCAAKALAILGAVELVCCRVQMLLTGLGAAKVAIARDQSMVTVCLTQLSNHAASLQSSPIANPIRR